MSKTFYAEIKEEIVTTDHVQTIIKDCYLLIETLKVEKLPVDREILIMLELGINRLESHIYHLAAELAKGSTSEAIRRLTLD